MSINGTQYKYTDGFTDSKFSSFLNKEKFEFPIMT